MEFFSLGKNQKGLDKINDCKLDLINNIIIKNTI